jgi:glycosyltransferase involved in cell wall biosynthesis
MKRALRVGVDGVLIRKQGKGVSRFLVSFLQNFATSGNALMELVIFIDRNAETPVLPQGENISYVPIQIKKLLLWDQIEFPAWLRRIKADLAFAVADRLSLMPTLYPVNYLMYLFEIPDYRIEANRKTAGLYQRVSDQFTKRIFPRSLRRSHHIAVSSFATRSDLISKYNVPERKITVIYPAADAIFHPVDSDSHYIQSTRERYGAKGGYVLHFSSSNDPRDNTGTALKGFSLASEWLKNGKKLLIGGVDRLSNFGWGELIRNLHLEAQVNLVGFKTGEDLVKLYQAADVYLDTSLYEGFGFQVAEALACGTPVICSNKTSLPEIVGDSAILLNPMDTQGIAEAILKVLSNDEIRIQLKQDAMNRARCFSWSKCTEELTKLFMEHGRDT